MNAQQHQQSLSVRRRRCAWASPTVAGDHEHWCPTASLELPEDRCECGLVGSVEDHLLRLDARSALVVSEHLRLGHDIDVHVRCLTRQDISDIHRQAHSETSH